MKLLVGPLFDEARVTMGRVIDLYGTIGDATCGCFIVKINGVALHVIAAQGEGWDHVSVSLPRRCPTWEEMVAIKRIFFKDDEWAVEYHPPPTDNISNHNFTLHLWRSHHKELAIPPTFMV